MITHRQRQTDIRTLRGGMGELVSKIILVTGPCLRLLGFRVGLKAWTRDIGIGLVNGVEIEKLRILYFFP